MITFTVSNRPRKLRAMDMILPPGRSLPPPSQPETPRLPPYSRERFARLTPDPNAGDRGEPVLLRDDRRLWLRPIHATDVAALQRCFTRLSRDEVRMRFLHHMRTLPLAMARQLCRIDGEVEAAHVLMDHDAETTEMRGVGRIYIDLTTNQAEFAVLVEKLWTGFGLGALLLQRLVDICQERAVDRIWGYVLIENRPMLDLCRKLGFKRQDLHDDPGTARIALDLLPA